MASSDPCFAVFMPLYYPLPLWVSWTSWLVMMSHDGMSHSWLGYQRLTSVMLADSLFPCWLACFDDDSCHVGEATGQGTEGRLLLTVSEELRPFIQQPLRDWCCQQSPNQLRSRFFPSWGCRWDCRSWVHILMAACGRQARDPAKLFPDSWHTETDNKCKFHSSR